MDVKIYRPPVEFAVSMRYGYATNHHNGIPRHGLDCLAFVGKAEYRYQYGENKRRETDIEFESDDGNNQDSYDGKGHPLFSVKTFDVYGFPVAPFI
jgi:hypothetical protein